MVAKTVTLDIRDLQSLVNYKSAMYPAIQESAEVMLWRLDHTTPAVGTWSHAGAPNDKLELVWNQPGRHAQEAQGNELDATEEAAYAVAIAAATKLGFRVLGRAHHGSGADWIMTRDGEPSNDYYKLEVSGIARKPGDPQQRLAAKTEQLRRGDYNRPGLAVVVRLQDLVVLSASIK